MEGMIGGAISGAISGAIFGGIHFLPGMGEVALAGGSHFSPVIQAGIHAGGGALSGGITAAIQGGDIDKGMLIGAISAGLGKYAGMKFLSGKGFETELVGRTLLGGVTGGIGAEISGDDFGNGFTTGAASASIGFLCNDSLGRIGKKFLNSWGKYTKKTGSYIKDTVQNPKFLGNTAKTSGIIFTALLITPGGQIPALYFGAMATSAEGLNIGLHSQTKFYDTATPCVRIVAT